MIVFSAYVISKVGSARATQSKNATSPRVDAEKLDCLFQSGYDAVIGRSGAVPAAGLVASERSP
jgi:hypothetical protein